MNELIQSWPEGFIQRMRAWLGDEAEAFFEALAHRDVGLRLNLAYGDLNDLKNHIPWDTSPIPWCPNEGLWLQENALPGKHAYHNSGLYYIQDPSAMAAAVLLAPRSDEWVLDLAAAPGGKATHIAARMGGFGISGATKGVLVANEISRRRASVLAMNLERLGVTNAMVTNETPSRLAEHWTGYFDALLVDVPCSGEGTFSRDSQAIQDWSLANIAGNARRQKMILEQAAPLVRPGGRLLYGTCTFAPEENEGVIANFLLNHPEFEVSALPDLPGLKPGHPEWLLSCADLPLPPAQIPPLKDTLRRTGRFWPHTGPGHGHFYALLRRTGEPPNDLPLRWTGQDVPGRVLRLYQQQMEAVLHTAPPEAGLFLNKRDDLYVVPLAPTLWERLRVLRPGWWVASRRHNKLNLDHALAMALRPVDVRAEVTLTPDDDRLRKFLMGGFWPDAGPKSWILVTVDGFPVGWGKRGGGRLRSRYPIHLRKAR